MERTKLKSSRDIAEMLGKKHSNILRDCDKLNKNYEELGEPLVLQSEEDHPTVAGRKVRYFKLNEQQVSDLISGYRNISLDAVDLIKGFGIKTVRPEFAFGEDIVKNLFSDHEIIPQFSVLDKYRIDWYIPDLKIAIEFDEDHHDNPTNYELDSIRQKEIEKELGCVFLRFSQKYHNNRF